MMRTNSWRRERCVKNKTIRTSVFTCRPNCKVEGLGRRKSEGLSPREFRGLPSHKTEPGGASKYLSHKLVELAEFAMLKSRETSVFFVGDCVTTMQGKPGEGSVSGATSPRNSLLADRRCCLLQQSS
jgi:hypothetical protein